MRAPAPTADAGQLGEVRGVKSADRTLDLLEELALATAPLTLGDLSRALSIPKSSLHGLLRTLERREWVESDDSGLRFRLGVRALQLASSHLAQDRDLRIVRAAMQQLWERTGETVQLGRLAGADVVYLAQLPARHPVRLASTVGERLPAHATALGKALLSARDGAELRRILHPPLAALTDRTLTEWGPLEASLAAARERGVAWDDEEVSAGLTCAAVTVPAAGLPTHAVSVSVPTFRLSEDLRRQIPDLLLEMAETLRARLGAAATGLGQD
jgi:DNA-binding IclR family transcriptional regulator